MNRKLYVIMTMIGSLLLVSLPALAHHGTNLYDMTKTTTLKGTITKFEWGNPHNQIYFDVTDDKGVVSHWNAETEPPAVMSESGWTRKALSPGGSGYRLSKCRQERRHRRHTPENRAG